MSRRIPINLNGTLKIHGIKDRAMLRIYNQHQTIEFELIKPVVNSKRLQLNFTPKDSDINHLLSFINRDFHELCIMLHFFQQNVKFNHGCQAITIDYNKIIIVLTTLKLDNVFDDLYETLGCNVKHQTKSCDESMKIIKVSNLINNYGYHDTLLFMPKHNKVIIRFTDLCKSMLAMHYHNVERAINKYLLNAAINNEAKIYFAPSSEKLFDYNFKSMLKHILNAGTTPDIFNNYDGEGSAIKKLQRCIDVKHDRIEVTLSSGMSIVDFVSELEELYDPIKKNVVLVDVTKYTINSEIHEEIRNELMLIEYIYHVEVERSESGSYVEYHIHYVGNPLLGFKLKFNCEQLIGNIVDEYYISLMEKILNING